MHIHTLSHVWKCLIPDGHDASVSHTSVLCAGDIRDGSEAVFVGALCAACCVALACDDGRDPSGMWPYPLWVWPNLACRDDVGCASPGMWPCPRWAWPDLVRCDAFDAYGGLALARKKLLT